MANNLQSNPLYYSFSSTSSSSQTTRTVTLNKKVTQHSFGVYVGQDVPSGLYVVTVELGSPAAEAQIQPGDRVLAVNGQLVSQMTGNPKKTLMDLAIQSQTLSLTIQSTDIFEKLNLPAPNLTGQATRVELTSQPALPPRQPRDIRRPFKTRSVDVNGDLESYIKSLFGDENIQILPATNFLSNSNEFILKTGRTGENSLPNNNNNKQKKFSSTRRSRPSHRHHRKRAPLRTTETQTSIPDENNLSLLARTVPTVQPSMGTSQVMLRSQKSTNNENGILDTKETTNNLSIEPIPEVKITRPTPPAVTTTAVKITADEDNSPPQHMVDIVQAAMDSTRLRDQEEKRREPERQVVARQSSPVEDRPSSGSGVYSVRQAEQNSANPYAPPSAPSAPFPPSIRGDNLRRVRLNRASNFNGFGFHLQYNKIYYLVHRVENGSPSETGGLRPNDVIHSINEILTEKMPHSEFVQIVNSSTKLDLIVQPLNDFQRAYPEAGRKPTSSTTPASAVRSTNTNNTSESGKRSSSIGRALSKLGNSR